MSNLEYLQRQIKEEKASIKIIKDLENKGLKNLKRISIQNSLKKRPLIIFDIENLKELKKIVKVLKPIDLFYIDNTTTSNLSDYKKQKVTMQDNKVLNGVEYHKQRDRFFKLDFPICINFNNNGIGKLDITLFYETNVFEIWVKFDIDIINKEFLEFEDVKDHYETENARKYNFKAKDVLKTICYLKDSYEGNKQGLKKINFYDGHKKVFSVNKKGSKIVKGFLEL